MTAGKLIRLFLTNGAPGGLLTAEIANWTGHIVVAPRSDLAALLKRPEASRTGVYMLLGDDPDGPGNTRAYIGEGDNVGRRLSAHAKPEEQKGKDFWDTALLLTSTDQNLTKAHARYLESRLISITQHANRAVLENDTAPPPAPLPEADRSAMEDFISQVRIVLPVLGVNLLRAAELPTGPELHSAVIPGATSAVSPVFELTVKKYGITARAQEIDGEFTVFAGSTAQSNWQGQDGGYKPLRQKLELDGTLALDIDGKIRRFTRNQVFAAPSAAAAVVTGNNANGRLAWKVQGTGLSYGSWQSEVIDHALGDAP